MNDALSCVTRLPDLAPRAKLTAGEIQGEVARLAALGPFGYACAKRDAARRLNCSVETLDAEVAAAGRLTATKIRRAECQHDPGLGNPMWLYPEYRAAVASGAWAPRADAHGGDFFHWLAVAYPNPARVSATTSQPSAKPQATGNHGWDDVVARMNATPPALRVAR